MQTRITFHNTNPDTIWNKLASKLGREPTHAEACTEVSRILGEGTIDRANRGNLPHQRKRS